MSPSYDPPHDPPTHPTHPTTHPTAAHTTSTTTSRSSNSLALSPFDPAGQQQHDDLAYYFGGSTGLSPTPAGHVAVRPAALLHGSMTTTVAVPEEEEEEEGEEEVALLKALLEEEDGEMLLSQFVEAFGRGEEK